jgi:hypothetical protein
MIELWKEKSHTMQVEEAVMDHKDRDKVVKGVERYSPAISRPYNLQESAQDSIPQCPMPDLAIFYVGYGLPHRVLILGLSPYTIYLQVAINIVDCQ